MNRVKKKRQLNNTYDGRDSICVGFFVSVCWISNKWRKLSADDVDDCVYTSRYDEIQIAICGDSLEKQ